MLKNQIVINRSLLESLGFKLSTKYHSYNYYTKPPNLSLYLYNDYIVVYHKIGLRLFNLTRISSFIEYINEHNDVEESNYN